MIHTVRKSGINITLENFGIILNGEFKGFVNSKFDHICNVTNGPWSLDLEFFTALTKDDIAIPTIKLIEPVFPFTGKNCKLINDIKVIGPIVDLFFNGFFMPTLMRYIKLLFSYHVNEVIQNYLNSSIGEFFGVYELPLTG